MKTQARIVELFDRTFKKSILDTVASIDSFLNRSARDHVSDLDDYLKFNSDMFGLVCKEVLLLTRLSRDKKRLSCGGARSHLSNKKSFKGHYDNGLAI